MFLGLSLCLWLVSPNSALAYSCIEDIISDIKKEKIPKGLKTKTILQYISYLDTIWSKKTISRYDERGNMIEKTRYFEGEVTHKHLYKYDDRNNLIERFYMWYDDTYKGPITKTETTICKYDDRNYLIEWSQYKGNDGKLENKHSYEYEVRGQEIERACYNDKGMLRDKYLYKYDDRGREIEKAQYDDDGKLVDKHLYKYDDRGNLIEEAWYDEKYQKGKLIQKYLYKYNDRGIQIEWVHYIGGELIGKWCQYEDRGNEIEWAYYGVGSGLRHKGLSKYDDRGQEIERTRYEVEEKSGKVEKVPGYSSQTVWEYEYYPEPTKK